VNRAQHFPSRDRLSVLTAIIILAYALARFVNLPARALTIVLFGSPLSLPLSGPNLTLLFVAALISTGADTLLRSHPTYAAGAGWRPLVHWIVPGAAAVVLGAALNTLPTGPAWWAGLALSAAALLIVLVAEYRVVDVQDQGREAAAAALAALSYALAAVLFGLLRAGSVRAVVAGSVGGATAALLAWRLFALNAAPLRRAALYAGLTGAVLAEAAWALNYWRTSPLAFALLALVPFYFCVGIFRQHLAGALGRRDMIEFGLVGGLALVVASLFALRQR
jgi:hypothetical protein